MTHFSSRLFCIAFSVLVIVSGCAGCSETHRGDEPTPAPVSSTASAEPEPAVARVTAGIIFRDLETRRCIEETASRSIDPGSGGSLRLQVTKSRYRLDVFRGEELFKTYPVALGGNPVGPKAVMGDERTPEGEYLLIPHHPSPSFGGCFYICYPNTIDASRGLAEGVISDSAHRTILKCLSEQRKPPHETPLGGLILLHGTKKRWVPGLTTNNWTLGCIAMENDDLLELLGAYAPEDRPALTILP